MHHAAGAQASQPTWLGNHLRRGILAERGPRLIVSLLLIPAILGTNLIYDSLNHGPNRIFLETPLDRALPVVPVFAIPYVSLIPYIGVSLIAFLFFRVRVYQSAAITMIIIWFVSYAFYFVLQSYIARPQITGTDRSRGSSGASMPPIGPTTIFRACTRRCRPSSPSTGGASTGGSVSPPPSGLRSSSRRPCS